MNEISQSEITAIVFQVIRNSDNAKSIKQIMDKIKEVLPGITGNQLLAAIAYIYKEKG